MSVKKYRLTLTEEQARIVSKACEFYARIGYGQYREIIFEFMAVNEFDFDERRRKADRLLYEARGLIYPELGEERGRYHGIGFDKIMDKSYDVHQVLRHALGDEREPWNLDGSDFATCEVIEEVEG